MGGKVGVKIFGWTDGWSLDKERNRKQKLLGWMGLCMHGWMDRCVNIWMDAMMDVWMDG